MGGESVKTYATKIVQQYQRRVKSAQRELKDGIIISVNEDESYCLIRVQNSGSQLITAWYNTNYDAKPPWMKPGNAIRIATPGGVGGKIEVVGHGFKVPTNSSGGGVGPTIGSGGDQILTGMDLTADGSSMTVYIASGSYKIDGATYVLGIVEMDDSTIEMDDATIEMDSASNGLQFTVGDVSTALLYRIDIIVIGEDSLPHVVEGTPIAVSPVAPAIPADHILLGSVLIPPEKTIVYQTDINKPYTTPRIVGLRCDGPRRFYWVEEPDEADDHLDYTIGPVDQYGNFIKMDWKIRIDSVNSISNGTWYVVGGSEAASGLVVSHTAIFSGQKAVKFLQSASPYSTMIHLVGLDALAGYELSFFLNGTYGPYTLYGDVGEYLSGDKPVPGQTS